MFLIRCIDLIVYFCSIDQFFECFDGMRSSQAGSSGIWNWTCSVFSAITVASNLASGSGHISIGKFFMLSTDAYPT